VRGWAEGAIGGTGWRQNALRTLLALVLLGVLVWGLPLRRPGEEGGHHVAHAPSLDPFERAGVVELKEGQPGPELKLEQLDGGWATRETWKGRLVILNFWATWCTPCTLEMPALEALWQQYRERGLVVVGVSVDRGGPRPLIEPYRRNLGLTFPILLDPDMSTAAAWRVTSIPATFVIKPGGEVAGMAMGPREWDSPEMRALLEPMLPGAHRHGG
jgi:peroxiredoxin